METHTPIPLIKALTKVFSLPKFPVLPDKKATAGNSTEVGAKKFKVFFFDLALSCNPFGFPTLMG